MSKIETFIINALAFCITSAIIGFIILTSIVLIVSFVEWDFQKWSEVDWYDIRISALFGGLFVIWAFWGNFWAFWSN